MEDDLEAELTGEDWASILETEAPSSGSHFFDSPYDSLLGSGSRTSGMTSTSQPSLKKKSSRDSTKSSPDKTSCTASPPSSSSSAAAAKPTTLQPLRKSCELCRSRKKKCDGDGLNRCSLCVSKGIERCVYVERISSAPKNPARLAKRSKNKSTKENPPPPPSSRVSTSFSDGFLVGGESSLVPMKRCRLSASPATGLVGMQENVFLSDYFDCMGLLPLTSEREVREAMVSVMLATLSPDQKERHGKVRQRPPMETPDEGVTPERGLVCFGTEGGGSGAMARSKANVHASICSLWCAVALGALVRGWPMSSVTRYVELARQSLTGCFDDVSVDTLRAYVLMSFLHNFLGDEQKFQKYLMFAHGIARALPTEDVPREMFDLLGVADSAALFSGVAPTMSELEAFCKPDEEEMRAPAANRKLDFCRYLLQADHRLNQAFFQDMAALGVLGQTKGSSFAGEHKQASNPQQEQQQQQQQFRGMPETIADWVEDDDEEEDIEDLGRSGQLTGGAPSSGRPQGRAVKNARGRKMQGRSAGGGRVYSGAGGGGSGSEGRLTLLLEEGTDPEPPPPGDETLKTVLEEMPEMRRMEAEGKWPDIKNGVGGFLYNTRLAFQAFMIQEKPFGYRVLGGTMKVLLRHPGLLRFSSWLHMTHCVITLYGELENGESYTKLSKVYNQVKPAGMTTAPPFEEFRGVNDLCQHVFCRSCFSKHWVKDEDNPIVSDGSGSVSDHPRPPGNASAEESNLPFVSSSESPAVNPSSVGGHSGPPRAAPAEISMAANVAAVAARIGITRVVQDDRAPPAGAGKPGAGAGVARRFCGGGVAELPRAVDNDDPLSSFASERSVQEDPQRGGSSGYGGGGDSSAQQLAGASVPPMGAAAVGESTVRGGNEERRLGSGMSAAMGPQSSMLPMAHDEMLLGAEGGYDVYAPLDASQCLLTEALLGNDSGEEGMWASGSNDMGLGTC